MFEVQVQDEVKVEVESKDVRSSKFEVGVILNLSLNLSLLCV